MLLCNTLWLSCDLWNTCTARGRLHCKLSCVHCAFGLVVEWIVRIDRCQWQPVKIIHTGSYMRLSSPILKSYIISYKDRWRIQLISYRMFVICTSFLYVLHAQRFVRVPHIYLVVRHTHSCVHVTGWRHYTHCSVHSFLHNNYYSIAIMQSWLYHSIIQ